MNWESLAGEESWGGDPLTWDPRFVCWSRLKPETNRDHALFLTRQYVDAGWVDIDTGKWTHNPSPPEWLIRASCALSAMRDRAEYEKALKEAGKRLYRGES